MEEHKLYRKAACLVFCYIALQGSCKDTWMLKQPGNLASLAADWRSLDGFSAMEWFCPDVLCVVERCVRRGEGQKKDYVEWKWTWEKEKELFCSEARSSNTRMQKGQLKMQGFFASRLTGSLIWLYSPLCPLNRCLEDIPGFRYYGLMLIFNNSLCYTDLISIIQHWHICTHSRLYLQAILRCEYLLCCLESRIKNNFPFITAYMNPALYTDDKYKNPTLLPAFDVNIKTYFFTFTTQWAWTWWERKWNSDSWEEHLAILKNNLLCVWSVPSHDFQRHFRFPSLQLWLLVRVVSHLGR